MCGICGIINFNNKPVSQDQILTMMGHMKHRGPDDEGHFIDGPHGFGFVRLSILDLSVSGHQPMFDGSGRYMIIHNGEIYNYIEIRNVLLKKGHRFSSKTDTEVVLKSYIEWGAACLDRFNGMWAFCIYDVQKKKLFCSRDRFGIKPFYFYKDNKQFIFASEIQSILKLLPEKPKPEDQKIFDYLVFNRTDHTENTFFGNIYKLKHGHNLCIDLKNFHLDRWYDLNDFLEHPFKSPGEFRGTLSSSIGLRLRSDVPVGVCLSGGLDSSSIVSLLLKDHQKYDLNTFSAVYGGAHINENRKWNVDETEYIQQFSNVLKNMHYITPTKNTLFQDFERFIHIHGEPVSSTAPYAQYKVMQLAKEHVVVTLDGQGGDEQLAGYHYFFGLFFKDLFTHFRWRKLLSEMYQYVQKHKSVFGFQTFIFFLLPYLLKVKLRSAERGYVNFNFFNTFARHKNNALDTFYGSSSLKSALINHFEYKLEHLLKWEDRNSMSFSIEARVPFLDHRVVEGTLAMDDSLKINNGETKAILRKSMQGILPERIQSRRDEVGFDTPEDDWFRGPEFKSFISDLFHDQRFLQRGYFDPDDSRKMYKAHLTKKRNHSRDLWKIINLELWFRQFIDR